MSAINNRTGADDQPAGRMVLDLLAETPGVPDDQMYGFGSYIRGEGGRSGHWGHFGFAQWGAFDNAIRHRRWMGRGDGYGCRLITFPETAVESLITEPDSGRLKEASYVLGFLVDIDSDQRRPSEDDGGYYAPTIEQAHTLAASVLPPTIALDGGGGVPTAYLLDEAVAVADVGAERLARLAGRFIPTATVETVIMAAAICFVSIFEIDPASTTPSDSRITCLLSAGSRRQQVAMQFAGNAG